MSITGRILAMKWQKKGHEFDDKADAYIKSFKESGEKIYIFGAGFWGKEVRSIVERMGCFAGFIDNDTKKQNTGIDGVKVMSLEEYMQMCIRGWIVIAVDEKYVSEIKKQLAERGLLEEKNFFIWNEFLRKIFPVLMTYHYDFSYVELAQISVTERCSLRCKKCAHACGYADAKTNDMTIEEIYKSADVFFSKIDLIREFVLIGGEPLLYMQLPEAVSYIGRKYRNQMIHFCITTNGTILPNGKLLSVCKQYGVMFRISNYSRQLPHLEEKYKLLTELLEENDIEYVLGDAQELWMDYGFDYVNRDSSKTELQKVFDQCKTSCREIRGSKYYFCVMARSVSDNMRLGIGQEDYIDFKNLPKKDYKKILLEFELGYSEKGYLDMCRHCNGSDAKKYPIEAAEQIIV